MFSISFGLPVYLKSNYNRTLHLRRRYFNFKPSSENILRENRAKDAKKAYEEDENEKKYDDSFMSYGHPDPLEFRNVGEFEKKGISPDFKPSILSKTSVFRDPRTGYIVDSVGMLMQNTTRVDQKFRAERLEELGPDLAAAHFVVNRGAGVKFVGENKFIRGEINKSFLVLPGEKDLSYKLEAIDFSGMNLIYEGISNLINLKYLSWISFRNCSFFDNWFLDHLSCYVQSIEYLDISGCNKIDHLALSCLYRFKKLKCVNVEDTNNSNEFKFACLTYENECPNITFIGLDLKPKPKSVFDS